jgi:hypothetical protein
MIIKIHSRLPQNRKKQKRQWSEMHLQLLEDYIAELATGRLDEGEEFQQTDEIVRRLMDILIVEESRIPDFIIDGDHIYDYDSESNDMVIALHDDFFYVEEIMKKMIWTMVTVVIAGFTGLIGFLYGFFTAPERVIKR